MPIQKSRHPRNFVFEKSRATLFGVLIVASAALFLAPNISTAEASTNRTCTHDSVRGTGFGNTIKLAKKAAWRDWRQEAKVRCGQKCAHLKNARYKGTYGYSNGGSYRITAQAQACYFLLGLETTKRPGVGLRAPTRLP